MLLRAARLLELGSRAGWGGRSFQPETRERVSVGGSQKLDVAPCG